LKYLFIRDFPKQFFFIIWFEMFMPVLSLTWAHYEHEVENIVSGWSTFLWMEYQRGGSMPIYRENFWQ
jgi:hypothetical protein